ncbi:undecaprenyl-diphosphatase [Arthrobacter subterraneus]|uniref:Undecaprenyl-diphosphatase n=1 Tax=Arthrobacter subterraneus TaxID=335973 RepID=A0A1G8PC53_9MICC|nr:DedA family protein [Arthrobacter subterraneus]SDI89320.1 undecaprenyl-diphosphatase [Arthrobacter subterraneus]
MTQVIDFIMSLSGPLVYVIIGALAFGEAAAFIGLVLPGETALFIGGVIASQGHINIWIMLTVAILAAITGDSVGYEIGRRFGPGLKNSRVGRFVGAERWVKGEQFLVRRGGSAVLIGRWVGLLRALVPALAGMGRMPYRTFLLYNSIGGTIWATTVVLLGYFAGQSYKTVEQYLGRASLILTFVLAGFLLIALLVRFAVRNNVWTQRQVDKLRTSGPAAALTSATRTAASGLNTRQGLITVGGVLLTVVLFSAGYTLLSRVPATGLALRGINEPVLSWFLDHQDDEFTAIMAVIAVLGHPAAITAIIIATTAVLPRSGLSNVLVPGAITAGGAVVITAAGHLAVAGTPNPIHSSQLGISLLSPAGTTLISAAILTTTAWFLIGHEHSWTSKVLTLAGLITTGGLIVLSHLYPAVQQPTDTVFAWAAGSLWAFTIAALWTAARHVPSPRDETPVQEQD